jgi:hypothetical protein
LFVGNTFFSTASFRSFVYFIYRSLFPPQESSLRIPYLKSDIYPDRGGLRDIDKIHGYGLAGKILLSFEQAAGSDVMLMAEDRLGESAGGVFLQ